MTLEGTQSKDVGYYELNADMRLKKVEAAPKA